MLTVVYDPRYAHHLTGPGHPERAARLSAFVEGLEAGGISQAAFVEPFAAPLSSIAAVHDARYVDLVERYCAAIPSGVEAVAQLPTGDTVVANESYDIALLAAGGALRALDLAASGRPSLAIIRPPGHHAEPARGMGFCVFNNVAVAAQAARERLGAALIVDFDYHHGNGTQAWVEYALNDGGAPIGFISTHAYPAYPGTGAFSETQIVEAGFVVDIPLPLSTMTDDFIAVWAALLPSLAAKLKPKAILVSAGFDFLAGDPIAGLPVAPRAVDALCALIGHVAEEHGAALALILEGGYSLDNLRQSAAKVAYDFGKHSTDVHVPDAMMLSDLRLRTMVSKILTG
ncbi:MAG TPA: histone deacetylase [Candidatus Eremiobacteraceae bacterium]|nr:histone deacetylase [Candidatus Eremiobacteraceae bacterium]